MKKNFILERFFAKYEFTVPHMLSCSDCEAMTVTELKTMLLSEKDPKSLENNKKLIHEYETMKMAYTEYQGHTKLRQMIATSIHTDKIKAKNILVGCPEELIYITMKTQLKPKDEIICAFPGYQSLYSLAEECGCVVKKWKMTKDWTFNVDELEALVTSNTKMVVVNFPHNPTGTVLSSSDIDRVIKLVSKNNAILFSDEMYRLLDIEKVSPPSLSDLYPNAVSLFGMSKSFGMPGVRVGWLSSQNTKILQECMEYKDYTTICSPCGSEFLSMMAIRVKDLIVNRNIEIIKKNVEIAKKFFEKYTHIFPKVKYPEIGSIGVAAMKKVKNEISMTDQVEDIIEKKELLLLPSTMFEIDDQDFVRIGYGREKFPTSLQLLEEYVKQNYK